MEDFIFDVAAFAAHPDDVEFCCGGTIRKLADQGYKIAIVDLTQGELGSRGSVEIRQNESAEAAKILGVELRENLALPDGAIDGNAKGDPLNDCSQLAKVVSAIRRLRPQLVFAPYEKCRHPDHEEASRLVSRAIFYSALGKYKAAGCNSKAFKVRQLIYYSTRHQFRPSFVVDTSSVQEAKKKAIAAYASQIGTDSQDGPRTLITSPLNLSSIESRDGYYGAMIGVGYGEAFLTKSALAVEDPLKFFASQKPDSALFFPE